MGRRGCAILAFLVGLLPVGAPTHSLKAETIPAATQVRIFVPWNPNGTLNDSLHISSQDTFSSPYGCRSTSIATTRPDAWRCGTDDPCFAPPVSPDADTSELACARAPWTGEVQLLTVTLPLRSPNDCRPPPLCRLPLDLTRRPWAVELANGVRCTGFTGTIASIADIGLVYGCAQQDGTPAGVAGSAGSAGTGVDRSRPLWRVFYLAPGSTFLEQVGVLVGWY